MNRNAYRHIYLIAILTIFISSCAKISSPTGGKRDRIPPAVVKSIPENGTKNFREKSIEITFDEYLVLDKISEKFMVSPPLTKKPKVFLKGKSVITEFDEELADSTTYTLYFQDAIKDLNEGNILENFRFVLSTGPVIDSLTVTGNVYNALNLEAPLKTLVLMYKDMADSSVVKHLPDYISMVGRGGYFQIDNVKPGRYRLYALMDADNSKNYNLLEEEFAFSDAPIDVTPEKNFIVVVKDTTTENKDLKDDKNIKAEKDLKEIKDLKEANDTIIVIGEQQLILFPGQKKNHYLTSSSRGVKYMMTYTLSLPPDTMKFEFKIPGATDDAFFVEKNKEADTIKVWLTDSEFYSQQQLTTIVKYPFTDSVGNLGYKEDTVLMRFLEPRVPRGVKVKKTKFSFETNIKTGILKPGQNIFFKSQTPFSPPDTSFIRLYQVSDTVKIPVKYSLTADSTSRSRYFLNANLVPGKNYLFIADSASFSNIYSDYSDSTGIKFSVRDPETFSQLTLKISNITGDCIIQLLSSAEKLISEIVTSKDGEVVFPLLESGSYRVRSIIDTNGDGKWTTGDFFSGRQPEKVCYYPTELKIPAGWKVVNDWVMGTENFKDQVLKKKKKKKTRK